MDLQSFKTRVARNAIRLSNAVRRESYLVRCKYRKIEPRFIVAAGAVGANGLVNVGDTLGAYIFRKVTDGPSPALFPVNRSCPFTNFVTVGTILTAANERSIVWGAGFGEDSEFRYGMPKDIRAVRGPITLNKLPDHLKNGTIAFGDPAILLPEFYDRPVSKKYKVGFIPHFTDDKVRLRQFTSNNLNTVISVFSLVEDFIDRIRECEAIVSSSLHGLIIADAYKVPALWLQRQGNPRNTRGIKFLDYLESISSSVMCPIELSDFESADALIEMAIGRTFTPLDPLPLLKCCPFTTAS